ncbi:MAG: hypothetical protein HYV20_13750 [Gemmatimonadetes bacterium]|nr:hypothetical protein [Gemmatimonadota bacterium]
MRFSALLDPDLNHPTAVTAGQRGRLRWVRPRAEVAPRESLAVGVAPGGGGAKVFRVLAEREGTWWPRAQAGDDVWPYDIVGLAQPHGLALAVGVVPDYDAEFVHTGDSAMVRFPDRSEPPHRGRVERVRYPEPGRVLPADVWVEIRHAVLERPRRLVEVEVVPITPGDSVYTVPLSAIAQLSLGTVVFSPLDSVTFLARWIAPGRQLGESRILRRGMDSKVPIVSGDLSRLVAAAEDSLRARRGRDR